MWSDVQKYVQECQICQTTNDAKFQKSAAPLHPIPVKSKVWNQVLKQCVCVRVCVRVRVCVCVCVATVTSNMYCASFNSVHHHFNLLGWN